MERQQMLLLIGITLTHALSHAFLLAFPALFPFIRKDLILTYKDLGLISGVLITAYGLTSVPSGWLSDVIGSKRVLMTYSAILTICSFIMIFVNSFPELLVLISVIGFAAGLYHPPGLSLISQSFSSDNLGKMFGVHGISGNLGSTIAPSIVVLVANTAHGWRYALLPLSLFSILAIPIFLFLSSSTQKHVVLGKNSELPSFPDIRSSGEKTPDILIQPLVVILAISVLLGLIEHGMISFLTVYLVDDRDFSPTTAGYVVTGSFAIATISNIAFGLLSDFKGAVVALSIAALSLTILCFLIPFTPGVFVVLVLTLSIFAFTGTKTPIGILTTNISSLKKRGTVFGLQFISFFGVGGIAGFLAGVIASLYGLDTIYLVLSGFGVLVLILLLLFPKRASNPT